MFFKKRKLSLKSYYSHMCKQYVYLTIWGYVSYVRILSSEGLPFANNPSPKLPESSKVPHYGLLNYQVRMQAIANLMIIMTIVFSQFKSRPSGPIPLHSFLESPRVWCLDRSSLSWFKHILLTIGRNNIII